MRGALGQMLVDAGVLEPSQLELLVREQKRTDQMLGELSVEMGFVREDTLFTTLSAQTGIPFARLDRVELDPRLGALVPEDLARRHRVVPVTQDSAGLVVAMCNPLDVVVTDQLQRLSRQPVRTIFATFSDIEQALNRLYRSTHTTEASLEEVIMRAQAVRDEELEPDAEGPVAALVDELIQYGVRLGATDIHLEPDARVMRVRYRIDGMLRLGPALPVKIQSAVTARFKVLASMDLAESRAPQDGKITYERGGLRIDLRVSTLPTQHGENVVVRILNRFDLDLDLASLGFDPRQLDQLKQLIHRPNGIILVTGPTGSGKTTTLYAALSAINTVERNIMTIEDPIEYEIPLIRQTQVLPRAGMTFAAGMRALLRQDPDVILLGEMRDEETASLAVRAALTGHLVFSTLHTNDAQSAVPRLLEMGVPPYLLATTVNAIVAQRLVRTNCRSCSHHTPADEPTRQLLEREFGSAGATAKLRAGKGCADCGDTGYRGRTTISELLLVDDEVRAALLAGQQVPQNYEPMVRDGLRRVLAGKTTLDEIRRVA